jgi:hypothetical protein
VEDILLPFGLFSSHFYGHFVYFMVIWSILRVFGIVVGHLVYAVCGHLV